ncbi:MAG: hypothetical protein J5722_12190 [Oscillospiraceae bacterium]|nr:hypothetical protein [Oscillospiraceae bacterium]
MKKLITYLAMVSVVLASVPAAGIQAAAADAPAVTAAAEQQKETPADIAGRWYYQESGKNVAYVMVETDGTYSYFNYAENTADGGTVKIEYDKHPDGTKAAIYSFYGNDGTFRFGCMKPETGSNVLSVGQDGTAQLTKDTKNYETAAPSDIAGRYFYQTRNEKADTYDTAGIVTVYEGGTYIYTDAAGQSVSGKVTVAYEIYPDGSTAAWYNFTDDSGKFRMGCAKTDESNVLTIGNGGDARLFADNEAVPAIQASPADLAGKWYLDNSAGEDDTEVIITVDENGSFIYADGKNSSQGFDIFSSLTGSVNIHIAKDQNDNDAAVYRLFTEEGELFMEGALSDDGLVLELSQGSRFLRDQSVRKASGADIAGSWTLKQMKTNSYEDGYSDAGYVTVSDHNTYTYRDTAGNVSTGSVFASYEMHPNLSVTIWYDFIDSNGEYWFGCQDSLNKVNQNTLYIGQDSEMKLERTEIEPNAHGFYDVTEIPATGISMKALEGEWINRKMQGGNFDGMEVTYYFYQCDMLSAQYMMTVTEPDGIELSRTGWAKIQYTADAVGKRNYYYVLYYGEDVDTVFDMTGVLPLDTLTTAGEQPVSFSRSAEPYDADRYQLYDAATAPEGRSAMALEGSWREKTDDHETILTFSNLDSVSGRFRLVTYKEDGSADSVSEGIVKLQYSYNMFDCKKEYLYVLYLADDSGLFNQIFMTIKADGQQPTETLRLSNTDISFVREAAKEPKYSAEKLMEMAKKDYQQKTGILPANAHTMTNLGGTVTVVLEDENGEALDAYTVDPETGIGERFSDQSTVNLPQTGNNSLKTLMMMLGAFLLTVCGFLAVRKSGMLRRRNNEQ